MNNFRKILFSCAVVILMIGITVPVSSYDVSAYVYKITISGTFGSTIDPVHSNLPDSTYPFPQLRGGAFEGTFYYDSMASFDPLYPDRFPYLFVSINIKDKNGLVVKNINTSPNDIQVSEDLIQFTFGPSAGIPNSIEDLRVNLNGSFSVGPILPPVSQILAGVLNFGFLETDGITACTYWDLPITQVMLIHTGTYTYFLDVPTNDWAFTYILAIRDAGITTGYSDGRYGPNDSVSRDQMAVFIVRALFGETFDYAQKPYFIDVPASHWAFKYIQKLKELGITTGCGNDYYCPQDLVSRDQVAAFLVRAKEGELFQYSPDAYFLDVPADYWAFDYIQKLKELGVSTGCGNSRYCPDAIVTRDQMAAFLARAFLGMK